MSLIRQRELNRKFLANKPTRTSSHSHSDHRPICVIHFLFAFRCFCWAKLSVVPDDFYFTPNPKKSPPYTHQFVRDPPDLGDLVRAECERYLSEVVIHVVVAVQLYDQDQLPGGTHTGTALQSDTGQTYIAAWEIRIWACETRRRKRRRTLPARIWISSCDCCPSPWTPAAGTDILSSCLRAAATTTNRKNTHMLCLSSTPKVLSDQPAIVPSGSHRGAWARQCGLHPGPWGNRWRWAQDLQPSAGPPGWPLTRGWRKPAYAAPSTIRKRETVGRGKFTKIIKKSVS